MILCDELAALFDHEVFVEIGAVVDAVFDFFAVLVLKAFRWSPAFGVDVEGDFDHLVGAGIHHRCLA